jgi:hypothetical protein
MEQKVDSPGWWLVDAQGNRQCLSTSDLIFIGREDCNVIVEVSALLYTVSCR